MHFRWVQLMARLLMMSTSSISSGSSSQELANGTCNKTSRSERASLSLIYSVWFQLLWQQCASVNSSASFSLVASHLHFLGFGSDFLMCTLR